VLFLVLVMMVQLLIIVVFLIDHHDDYVMSFTKEDCFHRHTKVLGVAKDSRHKTRKACMCNGGVSAIAALQGSIHHSSWGR
jgi:hypothetical protein